MGYSTIEDIACENNIESAFKSAKDWLNKNAVGIIRGYSPKVSYINLVDEIEYKIDTKTDRAMCMPNYFNPIIVVNLKKIKESYQKHLSKNNHGPEIDITSMFVYEITKYIVTKDIETSLAYSLYKTPHQIGREVENINRVRRGLKPFPGF